MEVNWGIYGEYTIKFTRKKTEYNPIYGGIRKTYTQFYLKRNKAKSPSKPAAGPVNYGPSVGVS